VTGDAVTGESVTDQAVTRGVRATSLVTRHSSLPQLMMAATLLAMPSLSTAASTYPTKPIRIIVPQSAGGSTDLAASVVTQ
jgi:hypothetical protein